MSFKSEIKSKKQKLNDKKFSKGNTPILVEVISSSDDQHYHNNQNIEKRSKFSGKSINKNENDEEHKQYQPKVLDLSRIRNAVVQNKKLAEKIVFNSSKEDDTADNLLVIQIAGQQEPQTNSRERSLFSYKIEGKQGIKFISQSHMKGRINSELKEIQTKEQQKQEKQQQVLQRIMQGSFISDSQENGKKKKEEKPADEEPQERKRAARYFEELESDDEAVQNIVKCFRCYKKGHIAKNCIQEQPKQYCNFCLQQHHHSVCDSSPCFRCTLPGHISQDCQSKAIECRKCKKKGHKSEKCGVYLPLDYHNKDQDYIKNRFKKSDLKKLKCLSFCKNPDGHFNCFYYNSAKHPLPYSASNNKKVFYERKDQRYRR